MAFNNRPELISLFLSRKPVDNVDLASKLPLPEIEVDMLQHVEDNQEAELHPSRFNNAAKTCVRVAFAKHIATWSFLTDPDTFFNLPDKIHTQ
jgi:hypothetical protein